MKIEYKDYGIEITTKQKDGLWAADVSMRALNKIMYDRSEVESHSSEDEAEVAAVLWAKARVDVLAAGSLNPVASRNR